MMATPRGAIVAQARPRRIMVIESEGRVQSALRELGPSVADLAVVPGKVTPEAEIDLRIPPDAILVDLALPGDLSTRVVQACRRLPSRPPVICLSPRHDDGRLCLAVALGAAAFIPADTPPAFIVSTIRRVLNGERPIRYDVLNSPAALDFVFRRLEDLPMATFPAKPCPLSQREREVLVDVAQGYSNKEIGSRLGLQEQTVKNHVSKILQKVGAFDRAHAAVLAWQQGWLRLEQ